MVLREPALIGCSFRDLCKPHENGPGVSEPTPSSVKLPEDWWGGSEYLKSHNQQFSYSFPPVHLLPGECAPPAW